MFPEFAVIICLGRGKKRELKGNVPYISVERNPGIKNGNIENLNELGGYGPFLKFVSMKGPEGKSIFPDTMGGGIGIERSLYTLLRGEKIEKIDDITFFGKNPDSHPLYLF